MSRDATRAETCGSSPSRRTHQERTCGIRVLEQSLGRLLVETGATVERPQRFERRDSAALQRGLA